MLETDVKQTSPLDSAYESWKADPSPGALNSVVRELNPTIDFTLIGLGAKGDPVLTGEARLVAASAVRKFDPERGAGLKTHVSNQLKQMHRKARQNRTSLRVPERHTFEQHALWRAEQDFIEKKGREPSLAELGDWTARSVEHIKKIRRIPKTLSQSQSAGSDSEGGPREPGDDRPDYLNESMDYVYYSLPPKDQKIFEYMTGYGETAQLAPVEIAKRMGVSQSHISRRFAAMMNQLHDIDLQLQRTQ